MGKKVNMTRPYITLREALESDQLREFAAQEDARLAGAGQPLVARKAFDRVISAAVKPPISEDRTSHSPSDDGSTGT